MTEDLCQAASPREDGVTCDLPRGHGPLEDEDGNAWDHNNGVRDRWWRQDGAILLSVQRELAAASQERPRPDRGWPEGQWPTPDQLAAWLAGLDRADQVLYLADLLESAGRGQWCVQADHAGLHEEVHEARGEREAAHRLVYLLVQKAGGEVRLTNVELEDAPSVPIIRTWTDYSLDQWVVSVRPEGPPPTATPALSDAIEDTLAPERPEGQDLEGEPA